MIHSTNVRPITTRCRILLKIYSCGKHCDKKEKLLVTSNLSFSQNVVYKFQLNSDRTSTTDIQSINLLSMDIVSCNYDKHSKATSCI